MESQKPFDGKRVPQRQAQDDDDKLIEDIVDMYHDLRHYHARTKKKPLMYYVSYSRA